MRFFSSLLPCEFFDGLNFEKLFSVFLFSILFIFLLEKVWIERSLPLADNLSVLAVCNAVAFSFYGLSRTFKSFLLGLLLTFGLLVGVTYGIRQIFISTFYVTACFGLFWAAKTCRFRLVEWGNIFFTAFMVALLICSCIRYPFCSEGSLLSGNYHMDLPFHVSIAAMIKNYGIASTGLQGLVETPYHVFSHSLLAGISLLSGVPLIFVYNVAHWCFFVPLFFMTLVYVTGGLSGNHRKHTFFWWALACAAFVLIGWLQFPISLRGSGVGLLMPQQLSDLMPLGWPFLGSESYVLSLALFVLGFEVLFRKTLLPQHLFLVVPLVVVLTWAKASTGVVFAVLWGLRVVFSGRERFLLSATSLGLVAVSVFLVAQTSAHQQVVVDGVKLDLFSHVRRYGYLGEQLVKLPGAKGGVESVSFRSVLLSCIALALFWIQNFFFSAVAVLITLKEKKFGAANAGSRLQTVGVVGVFLISSSVVFLFYFTDGGAFYFFNLSTIMALPFLMAWASRRWVFCPRSFFRMITFSTALVCLGLVWSQDRGSIPLSGVSETRSGALLQKLFHIRDQSPINSVFRMGAGDLLTLNVEHCLARPLVFPAISERPWAAIPFYELDCEFRNYNYSNLAMDPETGSSGKSPILREGMRVLSISDF